MALYTRGGDAGSTGLPGRPDAPPVRVRKDDPRTVALGSVDELNASIGLCLAEANRITQVFIRDALATVQRDLLAVGAILACAGGGSPPAVRLRPDAVSKMEADIDAVCADLPGLKNFILPAGTELACRLHLARAICRRAERAVVTMAIGSTGVRPVAFGGTGQTPVLLSSAADLAAVIIYLNRLSDYLFALARLANRDGGEPDLPWTPQGATGNQAR